MSSWNDEEQLKASKSDVNSMNFMFELIKIDKNSIIIADNQDKEADKIIKDEIWFQKWD